MGQWGVCERVGVHLLLNQIPEFKGIIRFTSQIGGTNEVIFVEVFYNCTVQR